MITAQNPLPGITGPIFQAPPNCLTDRAAKGGGVRRVPLSTPRRPTQVCFRIGDSLCTRKCAIGYATTGACPARERSISLADIGVAAAKTALMLAP
jgi:hypothetical protein